jgi:DtxR family transcriptional regulator, manganese transport regulator
LDAIEISIPHQNTRIAHKHETTEDYLEAVSDIIAEKGVCRSADLAKRFGVSPVTVHKIVERLRTQELVVGERYQPIHLSDAGQRIANEARERHQIVFDFLISIGVDRRTAALDSEGIEHHVSPVTIARLKELTNQQNASTTHPPAPGLCTNLGSSKQSDRSFDEKPSCS